ncbi:MAG: DUF547 domain-containing protein [Candidatus Hydrogenedentota bacterium]|nr:MAG: DUF547 domain-containing protein [Candidatus Hydrogenedentota bacterium]
MKKEFGKEEKRMRKYLTAGGVVFAGVAFFLVATVRGAPAPGALKGEIGRAVEQALKEGRDTFPVSDFDGFLKKVVTKSGGVDYRVAAAHRAELENFLSRVRRAPLARLEKNELKALFINAYNAYTIQSILDHPGVTSIRKIPGVWKRRRHIVGGFKLTLDEMEHGILRPYFKDARIHFAINCASRSCAPLAPFAYRGRNLDRSLDERTRFSLARPAFLQIRDGRIYVTSYFKWFGEDFGDARAFLIRYAPRKTALWIRKHPDAPIRFLDYDWSLNGPSPEKRER